MAKLLTSLLVAGLLMPSISRASSSAPECSSLFIPPPTMRQRLISHATQASGLVIGSANEVIMTATGVQVLPPGVAKWLPLFNEMANVASTSSKQKWIYSGLSKKVVDGVALGGIGGQALHAGLQHGSLAGGLILGVNVGLTYWFPNTYFKPIMESVPKLAPGRIRKGAESPVGQGVIGISMIVMLEQILERAQHLALMIPHLISSHSISKRSIANLQSMNVDPRHAIALVLLTSHGEETPELVRGAFQIMGAGSDGKLFSSTAKLFVGHIDPETLSTLRQAVAHEGVRSLLTQAEVDSIQLAISLAEAK